MLLRSGIHECDSFPSEPSPPASTSHLSLRLLRSPPKVSTGELRRLSLANVTYVASRLEPIVERRGRCTQQLLKDSIVSLTNARVRAGRSSHTAGPSYYKTMIVAADVHNLQ